MQSQNKVLLMGQTQVGKSSMHSVLFSQNHPQTTRRLPHTENYNTVNNTLGGIFRLTLFDCAGQDRFFQAFFTVKRHEIYSDARMLIYVFGADRVEDMKILQEDRRNFKDTVKALLEMSNSKFSFHLDTAENKVVFGENPVPKVVVLVNKYDKVKKEDLEELKHQFRKMVSEVEDELNQEFRQNYINMIAGNAAVNGQGNAPQGFEEDYGQVATSPAAVKEVADSGATFEFKVDQLHFTSVFDESLYRAWQNLLIILMPELARAREVLLRMCRERKMLSAWLLDSDTNLLLVRVDVDEKGNERILPEDDPSIMLTHRLTATLNERRYVYSVAGIKAPLNTKRVNTHCVQTLQLTKNLIIHTTAPLVGPQEDFALNFIHGMQNDAILWYASQMEEAMQQEQRNAMDQNRSRASR